MNLKNRIKGWLNIELSPEFALRRYHETQENKFLEQLIKQFNLPLYHYLLSLSDRSTAEDVLQNTWYKVIRSKDGQQTYNNVKSWLYVIARNSLIDELRKQSKWNIVEPLNEEVIASSRLIEQIEQQQQIERFNFAIESLPFFQREAFIFQQEGFSIFEISQLTDVSHETVKSRLRYAKKYLKLILEADHEAR